MANLLDTTPLPEISYIPSRNDHGGIVIVTGMLLRWVLLNKELQGVCIISTVYHAEILKTTKSAKISDKISMELGVTDPELCGATWKNLRDKFMHPRATWCDLKRRTLSSY